MAAPAAGGAADAGDALRLPGFFPRVPKQCKDAAAPFFDCFSKAAEYELGQVRAPGDGGTGSPRGALGGGGGGGRLPLSTLLRFWAK